MRYIRKLKEFYAAYRLYRWGAKLIEKWQYHSLVKANSLPIYDETELDRIRKDVVSIDLLHRIQAQFEWSQIPLFPIAGAADHKLLYILIRALGEYQVERVVEFGVGQSTHVLNAYARSTGKSVVSIEQDERWAGDVVKDPATCHVVVHCPLVRYENDVWGQYWWYDESILRRHFDVGFDLVLIDGPIGTNRYSRVGIVDHIDRLLKNDWLLIWDDVHRLGDLQSFIQLIKKLQGKQISFDYALLTGSKSIGIVFSKKYEAVRFYF